MSEHLTPADLDAIEARWAGMGWPWVPRFSDTAYTWHITDTMGEMVVRLEPGMCEAERATAIAHAPEDVADLLAEVRRLRAKEEVR